MRGRWVCDLTWRPQGSLLKWFRSDAAGRPRGSHKPTPTRLFADTTTMPTAWRAISSVTSFLPDGTTYQGRTARSLATCRSLDSEKDRARRRSGGWSSGKQNQATRSLAIERNLHDVQSNPDRCYGCQNGPYP